MLIYVFAKHYVAARYRASLLGLTWAFLTPVMMLLVYTFFFNSVFGMRWPQGGASASDFALILFLGLCVFNFFADALNRATTSIHTNPNFVTKIRFPLEMLAVIELAVSATHLLIGLVLWTAAQLVLDGSIPGSALLIPIALLPLSIFTLGLCWLAAAIGTYLRDTQQIVAALIPALLFLSPVFYPIAMLPDSLEVIMALSPIAVAIEITRGLIYGQTIFPLQVWTAQLIFSLVIALICLKVFRRLRPGFADVV